ncbi:GntR family transcriptional regulator [Ochrobactrum pecoris]|uniref:GntR family transcriptional regulator n=1 Tax=Brucella pecoris TaxID=867683 RepID=A0A5C5CLM3_9HYPH|nr:GntR family transcriptional regulator [Brucella pecoris]MBB4094506.1 DNA-binding GntR family transcriptional regulator [Brucella pecoris]NKW81356.1 GntR family transcriptional regulator [Brucella pecoris]TNV12158.1 GntR family transcriptional regulator [Brucella pecoris]
MREIRGKSKKSLASSIAERIRGAIVDAEFQFGENLSEDMLAAAFDVSRTPVREALNILQMQELVHIVPKSGTYVFTPTQEDIAELCDFRVGLEDQAMRLALGNNRKKLVSQLKKQFDLMRAAIDEDDLRAYGRCDTEFHLAFFRVCGNRYLARAYDSILGRVAALRTHLAIGAEGEPARSFADHAAIIELADAEKPEELRDILEAHIMRTKTNYLNAFNRLPRQPGDSRTIRLRRQLSLTSE